jgi:hypothetical protein
LKSENHEAETEREHAEEVLVATWVGAGKAIELFDGNLRIVLRQALPGDLCPKGLTVAGNVSSGAGKKNVCLRTGAPAKFTYRGRNYVINLSGIAGRGNVFHYYISVSR